MANNGLPGHVAGTSALPLTADIRVKSAFWRNTSASPPAADLPGGVAVGPFLTRCGPFAQVELVRTGGVGGDGIGRDDGQFAIEIVPHAFNLHQFGTRDVRCDVTAMFDRNQRVMSAMNNKGR